MAKKKRKMSDKKKFVLYTLLAVSAFLLACLSIAFGIIFDKYGQKPYVIIPSVLMFLILLGVVIFALLQLLPFAIKHDKKRLSKKQGIKTVDTLYSMDEVDRLLNENGFQQDVSFLKKDFGNFFTGKKHYFAKFIEDDNFKTAIDKKMMNKNTVIFIFVYASEFSEEYLKDFVDYMDNQYVFSMAATSFMTTFVIPILFDKSKKEIIYYEKWSKMNITLLAKGTKYIKKILGIEQK